MAEIDIGVESDGAALVATTDDQIVVRLPENASTGYQWAVEWVDGPIRVLTNDLVFPGRETGATSGETVGETRRETGGVTDLPPGAGGERLVRFQCTNAGTGQARLELRRVWETEPLQRFWFTVRIG